MTSDPRGDDVAARKVEAPEEATTAAQDTSPSQDTSTAQDTSVTAQERPAGENIAADAHLAVAETDTRRAQEKVAEAHEATEKARKAEEKAQEAEERAREEERRVRAEADSAEGRRVEAGGAPHLAYQPPPVSQQGDPIVFGPFTAEKPEVLVLAAFAGAFVLARILKAITTD